jgi:hypothetical protein
MTLPVEVKLELERTAIERGVTIVEFIPSL